MTNGRRPPMQNWVVEGTEAGHARYPDKVYLTKPGYVYVCVTARKTAVYVGYSEHLPWARLADHTSKIWWPIVSEVLVMKLSSAAGAQALEALLIRKHRPPGNYAQPRNVRASVEVLSSETWGIPCWI